MFVLTSRERPRRVLGRYVAIFSCFVGRLLRGARFHSLRIFALSKMGVLLSAMSLCYDFWKHLIAERSAAIMLRFLECPALYAEKAFCSH